MARISTEAMITSFGSFKREMADALSTVEGYLQRGEYVEASQTMNAITKRQAATTLAMRTVLIKNGLMGENDDDV